MSRSVNDGSDDAPKLKIYLNLDTLMDLRSDTSWPGFEGTARYERLFADGFEGVQLPNDGPVMTAGILPHCGADRIDRPADAAPIAAKHSSRGDNCLTVHAGGGLEDEDQSFRLVDAILAASDKYLIPIFIETHRATITQDVWRTVQIARKFPQVRFNADFSHYYCGQELVYGDWNAKLAFMKPIFERVGFLHGRIASPGCMQVAIGQNVTGRPQPAHATVDYLEHFKELWTLAMAGFLRNSKPGDVLIFAPELLPGTHFYARLFPDASGNLIEESDRYAQALLYNQLARACFAAAENTVAIAARETA